MSDKTPPAIGIDLGTTFSAIARLDETGRPVTIINAEGDLTTPSLVLFDGSDIVVGKEAMKALAAEAESIAQFAKRDMGNRVFHKTLGGRQYPPEVLQSYILKKMREDAQRQIGDFKQVVVTVPAYFDEARRKATQDAGYIAGLDVIDIINEPTAAAIAFGFTQGFLSPSGTTTEKQRVLVYDLGGGTFDVTIVEIDGNKFTALSTDGDVQLGGQDWDMRLANHVAEQFMARYNADPRRDARAGARLWRDCEDAKRTLSARQEATVTCDFQGNAVRVKITRELFEQLTFDLVERTKFTTRQALSAAGLDWGSINRVLLVGGSTRMPMIKRMLKDLSGKEPDAGVSADEAVAHGAALHAGLLLSKKQGKPANFHVKNVNSHSLGVIGTDTKTSRKRNVTLIPRNTVLPAAAKRVFKTHKVNQRSVLVQIVEGESPTPEACITIGACGIKDLPPDLPAGSLIEVRFDYATNGRLTVSVKVPGSDQPLKHEIERPNSLGQTELDAWRAFVCGEQKPA